MKANTPEFETLLADFENLYTNISKNKPMHVSLLVTLMPIHLVGGPMVITTQKVLHLTTF